MEENGGNETQENRTFTGTTNSCQTYRFTMSVGITGSLCIFGIVGNILTLLVLGKFNKSPLDNKSRSSAHLLRSGLAISDFSLLFALFIIKSIPSLISFTNIYPKFFVSYIFSFLMVYGWNSVDVARCVNTWIIVLVTMHMFIAIIFPHKAVKGLFEWGNGCSGVAVSFLLYEVYTVAPFSHNVEILLPRVR